ncbi:MAG: hypothetical protein Q4G69_10390 [Planctomycetia bacterium]|nr:hypothetical protein [Planctomycetia bacterium]
MEKTTLYQELQRPSFEAFRKSLQTHVEKTWTTRFGMTVRDVLQLPSGEVGFALIAYPGKKPGYTLIMDITDKKNEVNAFMSAIIRDTTATRNGEAKKEMLAIGNQLLESTVLVLPPDENYPTVRTIYYVQLPSLLLVADQKYLMEVLLERLGGQSQQKSLSQTDAYQMIIKRCSSDRALENSPHVKFFVNPLEAGEAVRSLSVLTEQERSKPSPYSILAKQGFDGIKGVGGILDLASEGYESVWRVMAYIPEAPTLSLKMLSFQNVKGFIVPPWMNIDAARTTFLYADVLTAFDNFGPLFDEFLGENGTWNDVLLSLEKDENGLQVNLRNDLFALLENNIAVMTNYNKPVDEKSTRYVASIPIKPGSEAKVAAILHRMFDADPDFIKEEFNNDVIWNYVPQQKDPNQARPSSSRLRARRGGVLPPDLPARKPAEGSRKTAFCVSSGYLFAGNNAEYLRFVISETAAGNMKSIGAAPLYNKVLAIVDKETEQTGRFLQGYVLNQEGFELNYNLCRQGKLTGSNTVFARCLRALTPKQSKNAEPMFDGKTLPPFDEFKEKLGPSGYWGRVESNGWFFKGFSMSSEK